jgi:diaminopimelate decarboxylase
LFFESCTLEEGSAEEFNSFKDCVRQYNYRTTVNFHASKGGEPEICAVVSPTCDSFDKVSLSVELPWNLEVGDFLYTENIGAYSTASSTKFNGFDGAKILHKKSPSSIV